MIKNLIEKRSFKTFIITVIVLNSVILGLQTSKNIGDSGMRILDLMDQLCLLIFVIEILLKLTVYRLSFFKQGWNIFDFLIVTISLIPASGPLSILRAFRIFRLLRLVSQVDSIRRVVSGMLIAIPGVGSVGGLLLMFFYIGAVISTNLFAENFPDWFGNLGQSMYTLFQVMTLESWSMGIVRPVMDVYPYAWIFFIPFIMVTTFMVLNLFIGIIVDALATVKEQEQELEQSNASHRHQFATKQDIDEIRKDISALSSQLERMSKKTDLE